MENNFIVSLATASVFEQRKDLVVEDTLKKGSPHNKTLHKLFP